MPIDAPFYYSYFHGHGRELLAETFDDPNPFTLLEDKIVERMLAAGCTPDIEHVKRKPFVITDTVSYVAREGQTFFVSVDTEAETIMVQEMRQDAYERDE